METTSTNSFSFQRVLQLCKRYVALKKRMILIGFAVIISLIGAISIYVLNFVPENSRTLGVLFTLAFTLFQYTGYAFSSTMFNEINDKGVASQFYTLPAKTSEKLLSAWLISYVSYTIVGLIILYIFSLIIGMNSGSFFTMEMLYDLMIYTMLQSIFIFGAVYFKANNFLSTLVGLFVFYMVLGLIYLGLKTYVSGFEMWLSGSLSEITSVMSNLIFTLLVSGMFVWFTFLRLKNRQIA